MTAEDTYTWLMDGTTSFAGDPFDIHVVASVLALAMKDCRAGGSLCDATGLSESELLSVIANLFPARLPAFRTRDLGAATAPQVEQQSLRDLLLLHASRHGPLERPLACMIARSAMEPDHLWQNLGLRDRTELSDLLHRHFAPLAERNIDNMKWKRFFYRMLCEAEGFVLCTAPVCTACTDYDMCFGEEAGIVRIGPERSAPLEFASVPPCP